MRERRGGAATGKKAKELFEKLGFSGRIHTNLTKENILKTIENMAKEIDEKPEEPSCFLLFIMSYGNLDMIYGSDSRPLKIKEMQRIFGDENCKRLANKPKIFLVEACQVPLENSTNQSTLTSAGVLSTEATVDEDGHDKGALALPENPKEKKL